VLRELLGNSDVCVINISMPINGGIEAAAPLKQSGSTAEIIFSDSA
jgi:DNA-binding NarL/FixJ family response regulator